MNPKRLWATAATIVVLSAFGPHSSGVWAQDETAFCRQGWDWVRLVQICSSLKRYWGFTSAQVWIPFLVEPELARARRLRYYFLTEIRVLWCR